MTIWADFGSITMCNNNKARISAGFAVRTRLELATYGVTGRYSNQLNYRTRCSKHDFFSKAGAKVLLFFELTKFFSHFFSKKCIFCIFYRSMSRFSG